MSSTHNLKSPQGPNWGRRLEIAAFIAAIAVAPPGLFEYGRTIGNEKYENLKQQMESLKQEMENRLAAKDGELQKLKAQLDDKSKPDAQRPQIRMLIDSSLGIEHVWARIALKSDESIRVTKLGHVFIFKDYYKPIQFDEKSSDIVDKDVNYGIADFIMGLPEKNRVMKTPGLYLAGLCFDYENLQGGSNKKWRREFWFTYDLTLKSFRISKDDDELVQDSLPTCVEKLSHPPPFSR